jgi:hypothetical protein
MQEDKLALGLTLMQVISLSAITGFAVMFAIMPQLDFIPRILRILFGGIITLAGAACIVIKIDGRGFGLFLMDMMSYYLTPRVYEGSLGEVASERLNKQVMLRRKRKRSMMNKWQLKMKVRARRKARAANASVNSFR